MKKAENILPFAGVSEVVSDSAVTTENVDSKWIYGPKTDLIIGCGAWALPLLLLTQFGTANFPQIVITIFYALALFFNYPHYMATIYRVFRTKEEFAKYKIFTVHITLLAILLVVLSHFSTYLLAVIFTLYLTWSPFHYTAQNFGIDLMFVRRNGAETSVKTRRALYAAFLAPYLMFFLAFHSATASDDYVISLGIPFKIAMYLWIAALGVFAFSAIYSFREFLKQTSVSAMIAPLVLLSTQTVWFVIPTGLMFFTNLGIQQNPATIAVIAVMHSAQYLWITSYFARREKSSENAENSTSKSWKFSSYFGILIVGGIALFLPVPWFASRVLHLDFGTSFLIITALVNLHHFILDGAIWKLRDGRIAAFLLNRKKENAETDSPNSVWKWFSGATISARLVKIALVFPLLSLALIDQTKFTYSAKAKDDSSFKIASQMNPYDASLRLKIARAEEEKGNLTEAQNQLTEAVRINPSLRQAQDSLARILIQTGKYEEAFKHYQKMFQSIKPDANALINYGVLAAQFDREDEALKSWQDALNLDNSQANAHFYLGELLSKRKDFNAAIDHYERFLVLAGKENSAQKTAPSMILQAAQSLGFSYTQTGNYEKSQTALNNALKLSENIGNSETSAELLINLAENEIAANKNAQALADFQRALSLAKTDSAIGGNSEQWLKFGKFLNSIKADSRYIYACFVKAETQLPKDETDETKKLSEAVKNEIAEADKTFDLEKRKAVKAKNDEILKEVLTFKM
ncbi:MAG TPA: tetratricopeptide repeat protein [Pyrinomonadaceae bacterium]|nr:tetratricopeptide repeat protein [Pyrinomonadaceae bacterium]